MTETPQNLDLIKSFNFAGQEQAVSFVKTVQVADGVECDEYLVPGDIKSKDLGIIKIQPGKKTPLQRVLKGERTIEGYVSGKGQLVITKAGGEKNIYEVDSNSSQFSVTVNIGELMQWQADLDSRLIAAEVCFPPYEEGRYENVF